MTSIPQDFTAWIHLLPITENCRIGVIGHFNEDVLKSLESLTASVETWSQGTNAWYDGILAIGSISDAEIPALSETVHSDGFVCVWDSNREHESRLEKLGFSLLALVALPSANRPRFVFDSRSGRKVVQTSLGFHSTSSLKTRLAKALYGLFSGTISRLNVGPSTILIATKPSGNSTTKTSKVSAWGRIQTLNQQAVHPTAIAASPGAGQKGVIAGGSRDGTVHLFCKVADTATHGDHLSNEARILSDHSDDFDKAGLTTPKVIDHQTAGGFTQLFLSAVQGQKIRYSEYLPTSLARSMGTLFADTTDAVARPGSEFIDNIRENSHGDELIANACSHALNALQSTAIPLGLSHRDFVFWNVLNVGSARAVIDWEWAKEHHIPFQDIFHFYLHGYINEKNIDPPSATSIFNSSEFRESLSVYANAAQVDESLTSPMFTLYLCDWINIQSGLALAKSEQTVGYRQLLQAVVDGRITMK